jgi:hypothetical protein
MAGATLQRVNVNLPTSDRLRLRALAKDRKQPEAVCARELLVEAIARAEKAEFKRRLAASRTPELRARERLIVDAMERFRD